MHPLKLIALAALFLLMLNQWSLAFGDQHYWLAAGLTLPLLVPLKGLWRDRRYTWKWSGFLPMLYFSIGVSEAFADTGTRFYGMINIIVSGVLFLACIYYSRYLKSVQP